MIRALAAAAASAFALSLAACGPGCEVEPLDALASPDGVHEVRVWRRTCAAQASATLQFELVAADAPRRELAQREQVFLVGEGARGEYGLAWRAPGALSVELGVDRARVLKSEPDLQVGERTVVISYTGPGAAD